MRRFTVKATLILILLLALSAAPGVMADGPGGTWTSWPFIQNPGTGTANVHVQFYDLNGTEITAAQQTQAIDGGESWYVPVWSISGLGSGFTGSMVVSSDVPIIAVSNQVNEYSAGNSYSGVDQGATSLFAPSIHANDWGWWAEISVQNTTAEDATVQVSFVPSNYGSAHTTSEVTIPAYSSKRFSTEDYASQLGQFVGAATITCTNGKEVVGVVEEWNTGAGYLTIAYNTIASGEGGYSVYFPSQHNNNWGWYTYNFVQNTSATAAQVSVKFSGQSPVAKTVPANGSLVIATGDYMGWGGTDYVGSLEVECTNCEAEGIKLTGIANEVNTEGGNNYAISYNASYQGNTQVSFPSQHNNNYGWFAYNFLQNLSSDTANITVTWSGTGAPSAWDTTIAGNSSIYIATGDYMGWGGTDFVGSLTVTSDQPIVGICNEVQGTAAGVDAAISYNGFGQ